MNINEQTSTIDWENLPERDFEEYEELISSQRENETYYELLVISHSAMSKEYRLAVNSTSIIAFGVEFEAASVSPLKPINSNDLDQDVSFTIGDINNLLDDELDRIPLNTTEKVLCTSIVVLSDNLDKAVQHVTFYADSIPQAKGSFTLKASSTDLSSQQTGEAFTITKFPTLRAI